MHKLNSLAYGVAVLAAISSTVWADGSLKGTVTYDGAPPERQPLKIEQNKEVCHKRKDKLDHTLIVNPDNKGIKNVLVRLVGGGGDKQIDQAQKVIFDQEDCVFLPHLVVAGVRQPVVFKNSDPIAHNVHIYPFYNRAFNKFVPPNGSFEQGFMRVENIRVKCDLHPWMSAMICVVDNPYWAVTDENGSFEIKDVPAGEWELWVYHMAIGRHPEYSKKTHKKVKVDDGKATELNLTMKKK